MVTRVRMVDQIVKHSETKLETPTVEYEGSNSVISTGSTLLDLAISGGRFERGGIPSGILVEIFGPSGAGKTAILCEIAGAVQRMKGDVKFFDPEGRLNKQFSSIFGVDFDKLAYEMANTIEDVFVSVRDWEPISEKRVNGIFADSLAALTTEMEIEGTDKYGMRRAKEFSKQFRLTCRILAQKNYLMVCSNQVRQNVDAGPYEAKWSSPGGMAIGFYASLRLRCSSPSKLTREQKIGGKVLKKVIGVETEFEVHKSSVWEPYHKATVPIIFDYGVDDIRANLQYIKTYKQHSRYYLGEKQLSQSLEEAIAIVEEDNLTEALKIETIALWREIEEKFRKERTPKIRS